MARPYMERSGEMEIFARVVEMGGFSAAAKSLDLTPSAVSKLIARLEARLGARLLLRTTRSLRLTEEGEAYHRTAQEVLQQIDDVEQRVTGGAVRGRLRISASIPFGTMHVVPATASFRARHPDLFVDLSFTDDVVDLVAQKTDVAVRMGSLPDSSLVAKRLGHTRRVVCASPAYIAERGAPRVPEDLAGQECLMFNFRPSKVTWPFRAGGLDIEQPVSGSVAVNNGETMRQLAISGLGIARLGRFHVEADLGNGALVELLEDNNPGDLEYVSAVYVGGGRVPARVRAFIDHMAEHLAVVGFGG
ncbi:MAG: LysR family transcriptional regulator [Hyphomicrobiales bacterium]|nr:LysR family transcriptional regulator [Hyphomicrobiales bacterium]